MFQIKYFILVVILCNIDMQNKNKQTLKFTTSTRSDIRLKFYIEIFSLFN